MPEVGKLKKSQDPSQEKDNDHKLMLLKTIKLQGEIRVAGGRTNQELFIDNLKERIIMKNLYTY
jgi:exopolysaccharide biosynthesis protein